MVALAKGGDPRPDEVYIANLVQMATDDFDLRDKQDERREEAFWQEVPVPHPSHIDHVEVKMGVIPEVVSRVKGILNDYPQVRVSTTSLARLRIERTTHVEDFLNTVFPAMEDDADTEVWDPVLEDILRMGRGVDELLFAPQRRSSAAPDFPHPKPKEDPKDWKKRYDIWQVQAKLPFIWRHLPCRNVFTWKDDDGIAEAMIVEERRARDVLRRYATYGNVTSEGKGVVDLGRRVEDDPSAGFSYVYCVRYWNRTWGAHWISESLVRGMEREDRMRKGVAILRAMSYTGDMASIFPNPYGYVPLIETSGITSSSGARSRSQLSIYDHMLPICNYLDQLMSQKGSAVRVWAWPTPYLKNLGVNGTVIAQTPMGDDGRPEPIDIVPGKMLTLLPGEEIGWVIAPENGAGADSLIQVIKGQADLLGVTSAVFSSEALGSNGYLYNSVLNAIRSKFSPVVNHIKRSHVQRCQQALRIVELYDEPIHVFRADADEQHAGEWLNITPKDVQDTYYNIRTLFEDHLPTDDASDVAIARQLTEGQHPLLDQNSAREKYLRDPAPERTAQRVLIQELMRTPQMQEALLAHAIEAAQLIQERQTKGDVNNPAAGLTPEQIAELGPGLQQFLGYPPGVGAEGIPSGPIAGGPQLGAPSAVGGIPGAPGVPYIPGVTEPLVPPPPRGGRGRPVRGPQGPGGGQGGFPPGQSQPVRKPEPAAQF